MKTPTLNLALIVALACACGFESFGQALTEEAMFASLRKKLRSAISLDKADSRNVFVLALPGIPLDPNVNPENPTDADLLYAMLNQIPVGDITAQNAADTISKTYEKTLLDHESTIAKPKPELKERIKQLDREVSEKMTNYYSYKQAYVEAEVLYRLTQATNPLQAKIYLPKASAAFDQWEADEMGGKKTYEPAKAELNNLRNEAEGGEPWGSRAADFASARIGSFPVVTWPKYISWTNDSGWVRMKFDSSDYHATASRDEYSGGGGGGFMGWGARASTKRVVNQSSENLQKLKIHFEVKRVITIRPWLDTTVFSSHKWKWKTTPEDQLISHGKMENGQYRGLMPLFPTSLVLVRNVVLESNWNDTQKREMEQHFSAGGGVSFGFFSIGGHYGNSSRSSDTKATFRGSAIEIPDVQIIGWFCDVLPKSPDPVNL